MGKLSKYCKVLLFICLLDLLNTLIGLNLNILKETNSLLSWYLESGGIIAFALVKLGISVSGIFILESVFISGLLPQERIIKYYRIVIACFLIIFTIASAIANI